MCGIVTGYSSGIGKEIVKILQTNGYDVIKLNSRLQHFEQVEKEVKSILKTKQIKFLINSAGIGIFEPHQTISIQKIKQVIDINLIAPMILTKLCLASLKKTQGIIINISSIEAIKNSKYSALYSASKAGLRHFSQCLFEEVRKDGIKVCSINPDITNTPFFDNNNLHFKPKQNPQFYIDPKEIASIVLNVLNSTSPITDITIRSQKIGLQT
jgi:short-subunit dehydrogenase